MWKQAPGTARSFSKNVTVAVYYHFVFEHTILTLAVSLGPKLSTIAPVLQIVIDQAYRGCPLSPVPLGLLFPA